MKRSSAAGIEARSLALHSNRSCERLWIPAGLDSRPVKPDAREPALVRAQVVLAGPDMADRIPLLRRLLPVFDGQPVWSLAHLPDASLARGTDSRDPVEWLDPGADIVIFVCADLDTAKTVACSSAALTCAASALLYECRPGPAVDPGRHLPQIVSLACAHGRIVKQLVRLAYALFAPLLARSPVDIDVSDIHRLLHPPGRAALAWAAAESLSVAMRRAAGCFPPRDGGDLYKTIYGVGFAPRCSAVDWGNAGEVLKSVCQEPNFFRQAMCLTRGPLSHYALFAIR